MVVRYSIEEGKGVVKEYDEVQQNEEDNVQEIDTW